MPRFIVRGRGAVRIFMPVLVVSTAILSVGCGGISYDTSHDPKTDFTLLETYAIERDVPEKPSVQMSGVANHRIEYLLEKSMTALGYRRQAKEPVDFVLRYRLDAKWDPRLTQEEIRTKLGFSGSGFPDADPRARDYQTLTLVVQALQNRRVIWEGRAEGVRYGVRDSGAHLADVAERLVSDFPSAE